MKNNKRKYIVIFAVILLVVMVVHFFVPNIKLIDLLSKNTCLELGKLRSSEYSNSKWRGMNFGISCIDNILYSNPNNR